MKKIFIAILMASFIVPNYQISNTNVSVLKEKRINVNTNENEIFERLKCEKVVFIDEPNNGLNISTCSNINESKLVSKFYYENNGKLKCGEIYKTLNDTDETIQDLKNNIKDEIISRNNPILISDDYRGCFNFSDNFLTFIEPGYPRTVNAIYNKEKLGRMVDYSGAYLLNNPKNTEYYYLITTHETYLEPTQTSNRNFKGVGVESILNLTSSNNFFIRDYAPKAANPSEEVEYSGYFGASGEFGTDPSVGANATFGFSYKKSVKSPKIIDASSAPDKMDIKFEYVDPGSWYGGFCEYNSGTSFQCSMTVLQISKKIKSISFDTKLTGRFEKYENWPFPFVDEYYSISYKTEIETVKLSEKISNAN